MTMIAFPSIVQFRNAIKLAQDRANWHNLPPTTLDFHGTVKLHGTNAAVGFSLLDTREGWWCQSRSQVITRENDNAGFAAFIYGLAERDGGLFWPLRTIAEHAKHQAQLAGYINPDKLNPGDALVIYGEWCGGSIQSGVALNKLPKMFVIFAIRVKLAGEDDERSKWFTPAQLQRSCAPVKGQDSIYCIEEFPTWNISIDMNNPKLKQNELVELTTAVEQECPVAAMLGARGVGEGIVWSCVGSNHGVGPKLPYKTDDLVFKVKGEKHSDSKVKTLAPVDPERVSNITAFANMVVTDHRLEKGIENLQQAGIPIGVESTGHFLKWVGNDVLKEEADTLEASKLDRKDVMGAVNKAARAWFMTYLDKKVLG